MITSTNPADIKAQAIFAKWVKCSFEVLCVCRMKGIPCAGKYDAGLKQAYIMALVEFTHVT